MMVNWPFRIPNLTRYISLDSEEADSGDKATFVAQEAPTQYNRLPIPRHRLLLGFIYTISVIFVAISIILTIAKNFTLVRKTASEIQLPYGNPIKFGKSHQVSV